MESKKEILSFLVSSLKSNQVKLTSTRKTILEVLAEKNEEMNVDQIHFLSHKKNSNIGIATVYRNINMLNEMGLVSKRFEEGSDKAVFSLTGKLKKSFSSKKKGIKNKISPSRDRETADGEILRIQGQLNEALNDLNKIKMEKELALENVINDFTKLDKILEEHNFEKNNLIQILLDVQDQYNWLPKHTLLYIGNKMEVPLTNIYSIASFYKFFNLEPRGRHSILVCTGTACHVRGSMSLLQRIVNVLGVNPGDTTKDLRFTLDTVNCLGCCALGPVMMVDEKYYSNPSAKQLGKILKNYN